MCDLHDDHEHKHGHDAGAVPGGLSRRRIVQLLGAAGVSTAAMSAAADPAMAAASDAAAADPDGYRAPKGLAEDSPAKAAALAWIDDQRARITGLDDEIWENAELSLREWKSSLAEADFLKAAGFDVEFGTAGFPTAFTATFRHGKGGPVLGFSGEYDALPGLSQRRGVGHHDPLEYVHDPFAPGYGPGHGCGHCALGTAAAAAAAAVAKAATAHGLDVTVKFFGSTAEEQLIGKTYAVSKGVYDGLDAFLDWHPSTSNATGWGSSTAMTAITFTFLGVAGHGGTPLGNKSALDASVMMATMSEFLREENLAPSGRLHWVINNGGDIPNVTPEISEISYYVREGSPERVQVLLDKVIEVSEAAAKASRTTVRHRITSACWNQLPSRSFAELMHDNMRKVGPPEFTDEAQRLAKDLQKSLGLPEKGLHDKIGELTPPNPVFMGGGSTDVADISWNVPTVSMGAALAPIGTKMHTWSTAACAAAAPGHAALLAAAKYLAATAVDLITQPARLKAIKEEFAERTKGVRWKTALPDGYEPPMYEPPQWFLEKTGQSWPPPNITWPPKRVVSNEKFSSLGPELAPQK
ncbi:amidohydrolase [Streptomyces purpurogeneiscleroticus]|uniref:amidohydrolase n=1 Tax=Streptomyces purpurogeneiscleroticus TaxID=68259 RepID=UPI001CBC7345|nr:amidohydrolase [Streptomyces purpurogeneiscleroticus]MBZ4016186.1 amidohydrolase [Streptomyces purpurogeneiscleroticus]